MAPHPIIAVASDNVSGTYRFRIPLRLMVERDWVSGDVHVGFGASLTVEPQSTILLQRHLALGPGFIAAARAHGCRLVHDLDDLLWSIPFDNPNRGAFTPEILGHIDPQLAASDLVIVSTEPLARAVRERGFDSVVLPNALDPRDWTVTPQRAPRPRLRVGWYGQNAVHAADLQILCDVVRALAHAVDFVFFGDAPPDLLDVAARLECHAAVGLANFPAKLAELDLDILLAPLADNPFNACKSNLRLIQAGMLGYAVIASDLEPHRDLPVSRVPNVAAAWIAAIGERIGERAAVQHDGDALRRAVHARYLIGSWVDRYFAGWTGREMPVTAAAATRS